MTADNPNLAIPTEPPTVPPEVTTKAQREWETLNDGMNVEVVFTDGSPPETVKIRKVPLRELSSLGAAWAREPLEIGVYVQRSPGNQVTNEWLDKINETSWTTLIREGRRLNFTRFRGYFERQQEALKAMGTELLENAAVKELAQKMAPK